MTLSGIKGDSIWRLKARIFVLTLLLFSEPAGAVRYPETVSITVSRRRDTPWINGYATQLPGGSHSKVLVELIVMLIAMLGG